MYSVAYLALADVMRVSYKEIKREKCHPSPRGIEHDLLLHVYSSSRTQEPLRQLSP